MERIPKGIYTQEFREQAIRLVEVDGLPIKEAARRLSLLFLPPAVRGCRAVPLPRSGPEQPALWGRKRTVGCCGWRPFCWGHSPEAATRCEQHLVRPNSGMARAVAPY